MLKLTKKMTAIIVSLAILFSFSALTIGAVAEGECDCGMPPLVYVEGQIEIYDDPSSPDRKVIPADPSAETLLPSVKACLSPLAKALVTDDWDEYCDAFYNAVEPFYEGYGLDSEGNVTNASAPKVRWSEDTVSSRHSNNSVFTYEYRYDQRLDPLEIADDLNEYIQVVKEKTNHSQVCLMSRCMGTAVAMAYLVKYGEQNNFADICSYVYYDSTAMGFYVTDGFYSGQLALDSKCISRYMQETLGDDTVSELLKATIDLMQKTYGLELPLAAVTKIYDKIYSNILPRILRISYGSTPGYWGMVSDEYYEQAKDFVFGGMEEEYSVLIGKLDNYHYNVRNRIPEMLVTLKNTGMPVGIVCKYGFRMTPVVARADEQSDNLIDVYSQSHGAACAKVGETFDEAYIAQAKADGTDKYISPDLVIDASACLLPDNTWFVKNVEHMVMPQGVDPLLVSIARSKTPMTIDSNPSFPQYLLYDAQTDSMSPLTEENCNTEPAEYNLFEAFFRFMKAMTAFFKEQLGSFFNQ